MRTTVQVDTHWLLGVSVRTTGKTYTSSMHVDIPILYKALDDAMERCFTQGVRIVSGCSVGVGGLFVEFAYDMSMIS